jgi:hypothetical protein
MNQPPAAPVTVPPEPNEAHQLVDDVADSLPPFVTTATPRQAASGMSRCRAPAGESPALIGHALTAAAAATARMSARSSGGRWH